MNKKGISLVFISVIVLCFGLSILPKGYALPSKYEENIGKVIEYGKTVDFTDERVMFFFYENEELAFTDWYSYFSIHNKWPYFCRTDTINPGSVLEVDACASVIDNYPKLWKIVNYRLGSFVPFYDLVPYVYEKPTYELTCSPEKISRGEYSNCTLKTTYYSKIKNINFKLNTVDYEISDVVSGDDFENLNLENGIYYLTGKDSMEEDGSGRNTTIITFKVNSKTDKVINVSNNVKAQNINYTDVVKSGVVEEISSTVKQEKKSSKDGKVIKSNPLTGNGFGYLLIIIFLAIVGMTINKKVKINK